MFIWSERHAVSRMLAIATVASWLLLTAAGQSPAYAGSEKGTKKCSDGIDNDGDDLIDCGTEFAEPDPDCNCGGDGGGDVGDQPCFIFDDVPLVFDEATGEIVVGDNVQSDRQSPYFAGDGGELTKYCNNKKEDISVKFWRLSPLRLSMGSRGLFVNFGTKVTLAPDTPNEMMIQSTDDALMIDPSLVINAGISIPEGRSFFFEMAEGVPTDVNLAISVGFIFADGSSDHFIIQLAPDPHDNGIGCPTSDPVTITSLGLVSDGLRKWRVETQDVFLGACIFRRGEGGAAELLIDVNDAFDPNPLGLDPGHIALDFGLMVTAKP